MRIAIGDEVRVHYHPPGETMSFAEGIVSRVDVATLRGRVFVIDVTYEVILDREQPVKPGYRNSVFYERAEDFPGRIERLSTARQRAALSAPESIEDAMRHYVEVEWGLSRRGRGIPRSLFGEPR